MGSCRSHCRVKLLQFLWFLELHWSSESSVAVWVKTIPTPRARHGTWWMRFLSGVNPKTTTIPSLLQITDAISMVASRKSWGLEGYFCLPALYPPSCPESHILWRSLRPQRRLVFGDISLYVSILVNVHPTMIWYNRCQLILISVLPGKN